MYQWKCLEEIARGRHKCSLTCMVDDDEESQVPQLYDILFHLADNLKSSDETFAVPKDGFESLARLLEEISQAVKEAEGNAASPEQEAARERALKFSSE